MTDAQAATGLTAEYATKMTALIAIAQDIYDATEKPVMLFDVSNYDLRDQCIDLRNTMEASSRELQMQIIMVQSAWTDRNQKVNATQLMVNRVTRQLDDLNFRVLQGRTPTEICEGLDARGQYGSGHRHTMQDRFDGFNGMLLAALEALKAVEFEIPSPDVGA